MHNESQTGESKGFGRNSGGWGIVIIAVVAVVLALAAWAMWNDGGQEAAWYRFDRTEKHDEHGHDADGHDAAGHAAAGEDAHAHGGDSTVAMTSINPSDFGEVDAQGNFIYKLGDSVSLKLPNGGIVKVGNKSTEAKLFAFLSQKENVVNEADKSKGWITCDRIFFNSGGNELSAASKEQIANLALILNAFPNAAIKVGGYTDNTGSEEINNKVSTQRALTVTNSIKNAGLTSSNIAHEGYGPLHPIASNDTKAGQAMNRRVDIRVTNK